MDDEDLDLDIDNIYNHDRMGTAVRQYENSLDKQLNILGSCIHDQPDPTLRWRAIWTIEECHDCCVGHFRREHFQRWSRVTVEAGDVYRDARVFSGTSRLPRCKVRLGGNGGGVVRGTRVASGV